MNEQPESPLKKELEKELAGGIMPTPEEDEELTKLEGKKPWPKDAKKRTDLAAKKASDEFWTRINEFEEKEKEEN